MSFLRRAHLKRGLLLWLDLRRDKLDKKLQMFWTENYFKVEAVFLDGWTKADRDLDSKLLLHREQHRALLSRRL